MTHNECVALSCAAQVLKSDHWKKVMAVLRVGAGGNAAYGGRPLVTAAGAVTLPAEIPEGAEIH